MDQVMPRGLKSSSSVVSIGFEVIESGANTFTQGTVDLNLSPLDREVFVVLAVDLDPFAPDSVAGTDTDTHASLTTTSQTATQNLSNANCMANSILEIRAHAAATDSGVGFTRRSGETPTGALDYIGIIATNDFFVQVQGKNNGTAKSVSGKLYGYRAVASADIFASLVMSESLSA
jgi:hypothetical protein